MSKHSLLDIELQQVVEQLCNDGCKAVSRYIIEIEQGSLPDIMRSLSDQQRENVLAELKSIMAVYDRCGD